MHWLTWREVTDLLRTWQGMIVALAGVLGVIYYGPRKILETWDWYIERFVDEPVFNVLRDQALLPKEQRPRPLEGFSVGELAAELSRSHRSVGKSIERLRRKNKIEYFRGGFRLKE